MKTTFAIGAAAVLSLLAFQPALAQDTSSQASSAVSSASSEPLSAMSSEPSTEPVNVNYGTLISSLQAGKMADLKTITAATTVNFVKLSDIKANGDTTALDNALKKNETGVAQLRTDVSANTFLSTKLTDGKYTADQVVAVLSETDGSITVVIDDSTP